MQQIRAQLLLYIPTNTSAAASVSATKTTVPSSHGKLLFRAAADRAGQHAAPSAFWVSGFLSLLAQLLHLQIQCFSFSCSLPASFTHKYPDGFIFFF